MSCLRKLLIAVGTSVNVGHFLDVLDQEGMATVPTNGHWLNAYDLIVCRLPDEPPSTIITRFVHTNAEFKLFRLDALALSVIATATWLGGWVAGCHTPVLYQNR